MVKDKIYEQDPHKYLLKSLLEILLERFLRNNLGTTISKFLRQFEIL